MNFNKKRTLTEEETEFSEIKLLKSDKRKLKSAYININVKPKELK